MPKTRSALDAAVSDDTLPDSDPNKTKGLPVIETSQFTEIWAYLHSGQENYLNPAFPITDIAYFGAIINNYGALAAVPQAAKLSFFFGKKHLVIVCNQSGLTHMILSPEYPLRSALISDLLAVLQKQKYDGLQIDFELVLAADKENFLSFLKDIGQGLLNINKSADRSGAAENLVFSAAIPARTRFLTNDAYDYAAIANFVDKVFVMAYDEHWNGSRPGAVASFDWCRNVASYALQTIGSEKLIMGQPFYGRTWGNVNPNRAFFYSGMKRQIQNFDVQNLERRDGILQFSYTVPLTITAYFDDVQSISERSAMYKKMGIMGTGFWCLGQEDPKVWQYLKIY